jgi:hypothetical protein
VVHAQNGVLIGHKEEGKYVVFRKMDGTRDYHVK